MGATGGGVFVLMLVLSGALRMSDVYGAIKAPVVMTIVGAVSLSEALQVTGIAMFAAKALTKVALPGGPLVVRGAVYFLAMFLSMFMNNSATIAIIGPMLKSIAADTNQSVQSLLFIITFAAGTCLTTPLGYQTNLMVMADGGYTFGDFTKYGAPIQ